MQRNINAGSKLMCMSQKGKRIPLDDYGLKASLGAIHNTLETLNEHAPCMEYYLPTCTIKINRL